MSKDPLSFEVVSPIKCNGKDYAIGGKIELDRKMFDELKAAGAISGNWPTEAVQPKDELAEAEKRASAIRNAAGKLDQADRNQDGTPKVKPIEKLVGFDTTAKEIAAALAAEN